VTENDACSGSEWVAYDSIGSSDGGGSSDGDGSSSSCDDKTGSEYLACFLVDLLSQCIHIDSLITVKDGIQTKEIPASEVSEEDLLLTVSNLTNTNIFEKTLTIV